MDETSGRKTNVVKIWWLASYPKSGNTWLRMFLSAYRNNGELDINKPYGLLVDDIQPYFTHVVSPCPITELSDEEQMMLRPASLLHLTIVQNVKNPFFVKTHFANCKIHGVQAIPPLLSHGVVYLVRDPRDVVISFAEHRDCSIDDMIECLCRKDHMLRRKPLFQLLGSWNDHVKSWLHTKDIPVVIVKYEDLIDQPYKMFKDILMFLKHEINDELLKKSIEASSFKNLREQELQHGFREKAKSDMFFKRGNSGSWKGVLTKDQLDKLYKHNSEMMKEFGYL